MNDVSVASSVIEDTASIAFESVWNSDTASYGSALIDLLKHVFLTRKVTVLIYSINVVLIRDEAVSVRLTILAHVNRCALDAVIVAASLVNRASLISDVILAHKLEST